MLAGTGERASSQNHFKVLNILRSFICFCACELIYRAAPSQDAGPCLGARQGAGHRCCCQSPSFLFCSTSVLRWGPAFSSPSCRGLHRVTAVPRKHGRLQCGVQLRAVWGCVSPCAPVAVLGAATGRRLRVWGVEKDLLFPMSLKTPKSQRQHGHVVGGLVSVEPGWAGRQRGEWGLTFGRQWPRSCPVGVAGLSEA